MGFFDQDCYTCGNNKKTHCEALDRHKSVDWEYRDHVAVKEIEDTWPKKKGTCGDWTPK